MCLCWDFDSDGRVAGMCSSDELVRRIHDPAFRPELKARKQAMIERRSDEVKARITPQRARELAEEWARHLKA